MRVLFFVSCLAAAMCVVSTPTKAKPPGWDFYGAFSQNFLWCQKEEDLRELVVLQQKDPSAAEALLEKYKSERVFNRRRCSYGNIGPVQAGDNKFYQSVKMPDGTYADTWFVNVGNPDFGFWIFWEERVKKQDV